MLAALALFLVVIFSPVHVIATTEIEVNPVNTPAGAVILIIDGLSSSYIYPELTPYAIDGTALDKATVRNISQIAEKSSRVLDISAPQTYTEAGHSVLVTGNSGAKGNIVGNPGATVYDTAHENGYLCFAVLEKGDFSQMRAEQDVVVYDETNSINNPTIKIETNEYSKDMNPVQGVSDLMNVYAEQAYDYVNQYPEGSGERYDAYNRWAIDTAADIIGYMSDNAPDQRYILTVNTGAVDSSGHYRRTGGYIENIEGIDSVIMPFYELCIENNLAFILTSDHGMAFSANDVRGGHQSEKYAVTPEAQKIPLIVHAPDVDRGVVTEKYGQEDIAPTILNVLNLPIELDYADGSAIPVKDYVNLKIDVPPESTVELLQEDKTIASASDDDQYLFLGIEPGYIYTVRISSNEMLEELNGIGKTVVENGVVDHEVFMATDVALNFVEQISSPPENSGLLQNRRHLIGCTLIALINVTGLLIILRILKEKGN
jgi:2,3-bisphosphoglycerate-independent phosphoglycerate mutase